MHGFKMWVPTDLRYTATPLRVTLRLLLAEAAARSWDVEFFDVTSAYWHELGPEQHNGPLLLPPPTLEIAKPWIVLESASCDPW